MVGMTYARARHDNARVETNRLQAEDSAAHEWYRFVLSFPPHLVRTYLERFGVGTDQCVLDPFCGTGTTVVECKKRGIPSIGVEANPVAHFASEVKSDWSPDPDGLVQHARLVAEATVRQLASEGIVDVLTFGGQVDRRQALRALPPESQKLLLADSISPLPLHKALVLLDCIRDHFDDRYHRHEVLAFTKTLVYSISNLKFGPEVGVGSSKPDALVTPAWLANIQSMAVDLRRLQSSHVARSTVHCADSRQVLEVINRHTIDAVITSPPYPNEKDYTRTTRLESVVLGFIADRDDLQALKRTLVRSNTRGVYKGDDDDAWISDNVEIQRIADAIESRRLELGKTSGFERLYPRVTKLYFGGMARHLSDLRNVLKPGAQLAYVVGDQASYLRVMIRTGELLADIGKALGYELIGIDLFRTRMATATREQLREEVVVLRWPGDGTR